jgi:hypothetical protein
MLPPPARDKLLVLQRLANDQEVLARSTFADIGRQEEALAALTNRADAAYEQRSAQTALTVAQKELERLRDEHHDRHDRATATRRLVTQLLDYVEHLPAGAKIEATMGVEPIVASINDYPSALATARKRLVELQQQLHATRALSLSRDDLKAKAAQYVQQLADKGRPFITGRTGDSTFSVQFAVHETPNPRLGEGYARHKPDAAFLIAWLFPEQLLARLHDEIDRSTATSNALSAAEKAQRIATIQQEILETEQQEEALIEAAAQHGITIARRPMATPAVVLGIRVTRDKSGTPDLSRVNQQQPHAGGVPAL